MASLKARYIILLLEEDDVQEYVARHLFKRPMVALKDDDSFITWDSVAMEQDK